MIISGLGHVFRSLPVFALFLPGATYIYAEEGAVGDGQPLSYKAAIADIDRRLGRIEKALDKQLLPDTRSTLKSLEVEVNRLRGETEVQTRNIEQLSQKQRDLYTDIDRRLQRLERENAPPKTATGPQTVEIPAKRDTSPDPFKAEARYQDAFGLLRQSRYEQARKAFKAFLEDYPDNRFSDNAQYWLGETNYVMGEYDLAIIEYQALLLTYPDSRKVPDALLKIAYSYTALGNVTEARKILEKIAAQYPDTTAARLAEESLWEAGAAE